MANWATTDYVIEGPKETLLKIKEAIQHPIVTPDSSEGWEGDVLNALGIKWENRKPDGSGYYMRGFIQDTEGIEFNPETDTTLSFYAEEAWGATDFNEALEKEIPGIKVYYCVVEENDEVYATNDKEGKYFAYRWNVNACLNGNDEYEDFITEEDMYKWLSSKTNGKVKDAQSIEEFNSNYDDSEDSDDNHIWVHEYDIVE